MSENPTIDVQVSEQSTKLSLLAANAPATPTASLEELLDAAHRSVTDTQSRLNGATRILSSAVHHHLYTESRLSATVSWFSAHWPKLHSVLDVQTAGQVFPQLNLPTLYELVEFFQLSSVPRIEVLLDECEQLLCDRKVVIEACNDLIRKYNASRRTPPNILFGNLRLKPELSTDLPETELTITPVRSNSAPVQPLGN